MRKIPCNSSEKGDNLFKALVKRVSKVGGFYRIRFSINYSQIYDSITVNIKHFFDSVAHWKPIKKRLFHTKAIIVGSSNEYDTELYRWYTHD